MVEPSQNHSKDRIQGKARIFNQKRPEEVYSLNKAMNNYKSLVQIHKNSGWYTPPKADG